MNTRVDCSDRAVLPWTSGSRLITLLDMKEYLAPRLVDASGALAVALISFTGKEDAELTPEVRKEIKSSLSTFLREVEFLGLTYTAKAGKRLVQAAAASNSTKLEKHFDETYSRFTDEAEALPLFYVHQDALKYYNKTDLFGEDFKTKFPLANAEIIEAGNCFAFDRFTACAFHLMRSLEVALKALFNALGLPPLTTAGEKNWNGILRQIKDKLERDKTIPDHDFYDGAYAFLAAAKNPMRNSTMHVDVVYDEDGVRRVFDAVGAFMRHIATKLKE